MELLAPWVDEAAGPAAAGFPPNVRVPLLVATPLEPSSDPLPIWKLVAIAGSGRSRSARRGSLTSKTREGRSRPPSNTADDL